MSAFHIDLFGPLHWLSKCQLVTAGSSVEAEIYAPNECVKFLLELNQIFIFLDSHHIFMPGMNVNYNDNQVCINWSKFSTTKGHCRIQMKENRVHHIPLLTVKINNRPSLPMRALPCSIGARHASALAWAVELRILGLLAAQCLFSFFLILSCQWVVMKAQQQANYHLLQIPLQTVLIHPIVVLPLLMFHFFRFVCFL